jgi:cytochrome c
MRIAKMIMLSLMVVGLIAATGFAAGNVEKGKAMFNDTKLGTNGSTCNSCHPDGKGLEKSGEKGKKEWRTPGGAQKSLEDAINICITMALKGKALDKKSQDMQDLVAYIKSLGGKTPMKKKAAGY